MVSKSVGNHVIALFGILVVSVFTGFGHHARLELFAPDPLSFLDPLAPDSLLLVLIG